MADLDDFFAKKDRKKSKSVKKFTTADELAKKLDEPKQKPEVKHKKERPVQEGEEGARGPVEEEWKEYEETVKDYTGLKIQVLQGGNQNRDEQRDSASEDSAPEGGKVKGPWNKPSETDQPAAPVEEKPKEAPKPASNVYVVPVVRTAPPRRAPQTKNAPDIHNDDYFPVLGAAGGAARRGGGAWSTAGGGGAGTPRPAARAPLALGNRFNTLSDDS